jgi:hypothetical protein
MLELREDTQAYNAADLKERMQSLQMVEIVKNICLIFGFVKTIESYHLILVTKEQIVGEIHGNAIYTIKDTKIIPLSTYDKISNEELRYRTLLNQKIDFSIGFYYSFTYDITKTLQQNSMPETSSTSSRSQQQYHCNEMFAWNYYTLQPFLALSPASSTRWICPCIYGFVNQFLIKLKNTMKTLKYTLISRRSRYFAGTRNLRRGVNYEGYVANEIETEQIITAIGNSLCRTRSSSMVQNRGSIPLFWSHTNIFTPNPDIQLEPMDSNLSPTNKHFQRLFRNFGKRVIALNFIRQDGVPREILLGRAYNEACSFMNRIYDTTIQCYNTDSDEKALEEDSSGYQSGAELIYVAYDMLRDNHHSVDGKSLMISNLNHLSQKHFHLTGFFTHGFIGSTIASKPVVYERFDKSSFAADMYLSLTDESSRDSKDVQNPLIASEDENDNKSILSELNHSLSFDEDDMVDINAKLHHDQKSGQEIDGDIVTQASNIMINWYNNFQESVTSNNRSSIHDPQLSYQSFYHPSKPPKTTYPDTEKPEIKSDDRIDLGIGQGCPNGLLQYGIIRSNCVDCLDRTNIGQFCYSKTVFPMQLMSLGVSLTAGGLAKLTSKIMNVWVNHGDAMAQQYGGSISMHKLDETSDTGKKEIVVGGGALNAVTAMQRYYSNISTDFERQQAMDLLLGVFIPYTGYQQVWEVDQKPQNMRYPSSIESCLIPFPLTVENERSVDNNLTSFRKFDQDAYLYGVDGVEDVDYAPYPSALVPSHALHMQDIGQVATRSPGKSTRDRLVKDYEDIHQTKEHNAFLGNSAETFNCYGSDDVHGLEKANYTAYVQETSMTGNITAPDIPMTTTLKSLADERLTSRTKSYQPSFVLPLPSEFESWAKDPLNWQHHNVLAQGNNLIDFILVSFPKFGSQVDEQDIPLRVIPTYRIDAGDADSEEGSSMDESAEDVDHIENQDAAGFIMQSTSNPSLNITAILGAEAVESISQPFKWLFQSSSSS